MSDKPIGRVYSGLSGAMRSSPWLAAEDITAVGDVKVTIEEVFNYDSVEFDAGRTKKNVFTVKFAGKEKELVLNSSNRKAIVKKYGAHTKDWKGKEITIFHDKTVKMKGQAVGGIRIRQEEAAIRG